MIKDNKFLLLREKAEQILKLSGADGDFELSDDIQKLIEELNIYQIELQMQNTELQQVNQKIAEEKMRYLDLYMNAPIAYLTLNKTGNIIEINNLAAHLLQLPVHQFRHTSIFPFIAEESKIKFTQYFKNFFLSEKIEYGELTFNTADNQLIYTKLSAICYYDTKHNEMLCRCALTDVSELKMLKYEKEQLNTILRFDNLVKYIPVAYHSLDEAGKIIDINNDWINLLSYSKEEVIGKKFGDFWLPETRNNFLKKFNKFKNQGFIDNAEISLLRKDGQIITIILTGRVELNEKGEFERTHCILVDITQRKILDTKIKQSEKKYRQLFEFMPVGISLADKDGQLIETNQTAARILGMSQEQHNQRTIDATQWKIIRTDGTIMPPEEFASVRALKENKLIENVEMGIWKTENNITWINVNAIPKTYDEGIIISYTDISEKIEREKKILQFTEELKIANSTKDKFFGIIAHDLKNPFNSILGFSDLLLVNITNYEKDKIIKFVKNINLSSKNAYELLENLLVWARTQAGKIEFSPSKINIKNIVRDNCTLLSVQALKKEVEIINKVAEDYIIFADYNMINTIIRNLITNAIKFTKPNGKVTIAIQKNENKYLINIADTGIGISQENIQKLFRIESKFQTTGTADEKGTGLGLILCKEFVEKHNGQIWVESEQGKGSNFKFTIPII